MRYAHARFDQVALVTYSTDAAIVRELNCVQDRGAPPIEYGAGVWDPNPAPDNAWIWCYDHRTGNGGYTGTYDISPTSGSLMYAIEDMQVVGERNIAAAIKQALAALSAQNGHMGRSNTTGVIVLLTDGRADQYPDDGCQNEDLWPSGGAAEDCAIYYANLARENNIIIHTIGHGRQIDSQLLRKIADSTGGSFFYVSEYDYELLDRVYSMIWLNPSCPYPGRPTFFSGLNLLSDSCQTLSISQAVTPSTGTGPMTFTISVSSTGEYSATGVTVQSVIPYNTVFITASGNFTPANPAPGEMITWDVGPYNSYFYELEPDGTPVSVTLMLSPMLPLRTFTNTAQVHIMGPRSMDAWAAVVVTQSEPLLSVVKTVVPTIVSGNQPFTYTIAVRNTGAADALSVHISDALPIGTSFVSATGSFSPSHPAGGETIVWEFDKLPNNGISLTVSIVLTTATPQETSLLANTATVTCTHGVAASGSVTLNVIPRWRYLYLPVILKTRMP
ncbi:MAG: DUF11 domain-containing protein [Anaerolineae bacterium]|nr:DUF11 domain-containing protein [Anaerolineae bacterium]